MKKIALLFFATACLFGSEISVKYDIKFGVFGKVGEAYAHLIKDEKNQTYEITMDAKAEGLANSLSGDRREYFYSKGKIFKGLLVPDVYKHRVERNKKGKIRIREKVYTFDYYAKKIKYEKSSYNKGEKPNKSSEILEYFAQNDLLTLFFNFFKIKTDSDYFAIIAAGANKKDGRVDIKIPSGKEKIKLQKALDTKNQVYIAFINQDIFSSKRGELHLSINKDGYADKAILRDVLFFGDIVGEISK